MRKLIWKELYEQRYIPLACSALLASIMIACYGFTFWEAQHDKMPADLLTIGPTFGMLAAAIAILGLFPGSSAVAPEVGQGTLGFLGLLPGSRTRLWSSKVIAGVVTIALSLAAVLLIYCVTLLCLFGHAKVSMALGHFQEWTAAYDMRLNLLLVAEIILFGYAVSLFFSTIVDRTVTASVLSFVAVIALGFVVGSIVSAISSSASGQWDGEYILVWIAAFLDIAFLSSSCMAFCTGSTLRSVAHVRIALGALLVWFIIGGLCLATYTRLFAQRSYTAISLDASLQSSPAASAPAFWIAPKGYADYFAVPKLKGWTVAQIREVPSAEASTAAIAKIPSDNADSDRKLINNCRLSYKEQFVVAGNPPVYLKHKIEGVLKKKPNFFYAQYCLASWYAQNGQWDAWRLWRDRALNNAPAILAGRFQYDDGRPVVHGNFEMQVSITRWNTSKKQSGFAYLPFSNVVTDENGCYYVPVYRGVYNIYNTTQNWLGGYFLDWANNPNGVMEQLTKTMSIESILLGNIKSITRVGLLPPTIARPQVSWTSTPASTSTSKKNPAILNANDLDISWKPYPKADFYRVTLDEYATDTGGQIMYNNEIVSSNRLYEGFATKNSAPTAMHFDLSGLNPAFNPHSIYLLHITAFRGTPNDNPEQYADSQDFYFIPKAGRGPIPVPRNPFLMD